MAAITAATIAVAATAAATAYSASQKGKGGPKSLAAAGYVGPGQNERLFNRGTREILNTERSILDDAISQGKLLEPEMYAALGLKPVYDKPEDPELATLTQALSARETRINEIRGERAALVRAGKGLKGKAKKRAVKDEARAKKNLDREAKRLNTEIAALRGEVETRGAVGRRVVGFEPIGGVADPTGSAGNAFGGALNDFNAHLAAALAGEEPLDPTLKSSFDERERVLRERLRRQMGPDYETSTAGADALANFDRERSEAFAQYNRQSIEGFSALAEHRATTLQDLTTGRLKNLMIPSTFRSQLAGELGGVARDRLAYTQTERGEREGRGRAMARISEARAQEQQARTEMITSLLSGVASAAGGYAGGGAGAALAGTAGPSQDAIRGGATVPVGSEFDTAGLLGAGGNLSPSAGTLFGR